MANTSVKTTDTVTVGYLQSYDTKIKDWSKIRLKSEIVGENKNKVKKYTIQQGRRGADGSYTYDYTDPITIDIPVDLVVESGSVVVVDDEHPVTGIANGTYIKLVIANDPQNPIYIDVKDLAQVYTVKANADQVQLAKSATNELSAEIVDGSVDTAALGALAVTEAKVAADAITTAKIKDANVTVDKLAADAVETAKIKDANVTEAKLAENSVTTAKITDANVTLAKLEASIQTKINSIEYADPNPDPESGYDPFDWF